MYARVVRSRSLLLVAAVALGAACRRAPRVPRVPPLVLVRVAVESMTETRVDGQALYFLHEHEAVRAAADGVRRVSLRGNACVGDGEHLRGVALVPQGDGRHAVALGSASNVPFDLWGHSGRHVTVHCLVDFDRGVAEPNENARSALYREGGARRWSYRHDPPSLVAIDPRTGATSTLVFEQRYAHHCELAETSSTLAVVCPVYAYNSQGNYASSFLRMTRFDLRGPQPERLGEVTTPIAQPHQPDYLTLSPDGHVAVYWGFEPVGPEPTEVYERTILVASVDDGRVLFTERMRVPWNYRGTAVAALPDQHGVLVGDWVDGGNRLRRLRLDGTVARRWDLDEAPVHMHATASADRAWVVGYANALLVRIE